MFCARCGKSNDEGVQFCASCGYDLKQTTPSSGESLPAGVMPPSLVALAEAPKAEEAQPSDLAPGTLVSGHYRIERKIGKGGMGAVYLATDQRISRPVALKFIVIHQRWQQRELYLRFIREAKVCLDLTHPNIVRVYHLDEWEGQPYLAMEYLEGLSLRDKLDQDKQKGRRLEWPMVSAILQALLGAIGYAHSQGVIHRDLKPANVMLARKRSGGWRLVVMDFGLAKPPEEDHLTQLGAAMGTPFYMAPEQWGQGPMDPRADLYSLGVMAYEMLTGGLPAGQPTPPSKQRPDLPEGVDAWVFKAMALDPLERFASAKEMTEALRLIGVKIEVSPKVEIEPKAEAAGARTSLLVSAEEEGLEWRAGEEVTRALEAKSRSRRFRKRVLLAIALCASGLAVVAVVIWSVNEFALTSPPVILTAVAPPAPPTLPDTRSPQDRAKDYAETHSGLNLEMVWVPAGTFQMGSNDGKDDEKPVHTVTLDGLWIGKYEITQKQYEAVLGSNPSQLKGPNKPVERVSWNDAMEFCRKLSQATGKTYTLPTEAQWEYACRAGSTTEYCFGDSESGLSDYAWYVSNSGGQTHDVGGKRPNAWRLYDLHGNVWEWCADWHSENYYASSPQRNPPGPSGGAMRAYRGGAWKYSSNSCRSAVRYQNASDSRGGVVGFRVVRTQIPAVPVAFIVPSATPTPAASIAAIPTSATISPVTTPKPGAASVQDIRDATARAKDYTESHDGLNLEIVWIPAGTFQMGGKSKHTVELDGFWIGRYELTQRQYEALIGTNPSNFKGSNRPVEMVSWEDATTFCRKLSQATGKQYTLPTEAQWEYACRAGSTTDYCFGDSESGLDAYVWYTKNSRRETHDVGQKRPNAWGLYDMHGNVWEWCYDWFAEKYWTSSPQRNPTGPDSGTLWWRPGEVFRVTRSGGWNCGPDYCRSAYRLWVSPYTRRNENGFRVARNQIPPGVVSATPTPAVTVPALP